MQSHEIQLRDALRETDPVLRGIIDSIDFPSFANTHDVFEDLCSCILDMRIHYAGSNAAFRYKRLKKLMQGAAITPDFVLANDPDYWGPLKLSRQKAESLKLWAEYWEELNLSQVDWNTLSNNEIYDLLEPVKGVSRWTVMMILLFTLERPDEFPETDYQLKKAVCEVYGFEEDKKLPERIRELGDRWKPNRSLAVRYLWRWRQPVRS
ncbi:hypothetical protein HZ996_06070 [Cryomorphaceae bacterium]|nr:hypothetical protein HZ996_06070 [Cryomorphaceae bacterium]